MKIITLCAVAATMLGSAALTTGASNAAPFSKDAAMSQPSSSLVEVKMSKKQRMMAAKKKKMMRSNMNNDSQMNSGSQMNRGSPMNSGSQMNNTPMNNSTPMNNGGRM